MNAELSGFMDRLSSTLLRLCPFQEGRGWNVVASLDKCGKLASVIVLSASFLCLRGKRRCIVGRILAAFDL